MKKITYMLSALCLLGAVNAFALDVWEPKAGTGAVETNESRLVVYGDQWSRHELAGHSGGYNRWRNPVNTYVGGPEVDAYEYLDYDYYDADGDGSTNDGYLAYYSFSETHRLGMGEWPTVGIYPTPVNWRFTGGGHVECVRF